MSYDIRTTCGYNRERPWAVFKLYKGVWTLLYTNATERQCRDWLRTMQHQGRLPR